MIYAILSAQKTFWSPFYFLSWLLCFHRAAGLHVAAKKQANKRNGQAASGFNVVADRCLRNI